MKRAPPYPLLWPRRTAGSRLRVIALTGTVPGAIESTVREVLATLPADRFDVTIARLERGSSPATSPIVPGRDIERRLALSPALDVDDAKRIALLDPDLLVDLVGPEASTATLLACRSARAMLVVARPGRTRMDSYRDRDVISPDALRARLDRLHEAVTNGLVSDRAGPSVPDASTMALRWEEAVRTHQRGEARDARMQYEVILALQPGYAPAHYLLGLLLRDAGDAAGARMHFNAALDVAPRFVEARTAAANMARSSGDAAGAIALCMAGLPDGQENAPLWRALGLAQLSAGDAVAATRSLTHALNLFPEDAETCFNLGVAFQKQGRADAAEQAYRRAIAAEPGFVDASFNLGTLYQESGAHDAAVAAYRAVLEADPRHCAAYWHLGEVLFAAGRVDAWFANFRRFEANCSDALPMMVQALEACHYLADFRKLDAYLDRIAGGRFVVQDDVELVDCLEQLLYLLLFFDTAPETNLRLARTYDAAARRIHGEPLPRNLFRKPGRLRVGYLSGDLRDHVMGKMMWEVLQHHDKQRFELFFYSLSRAEDEWTRRFRALADRFEVVASLPERVAAEHIARDDLDVLVDLSAHTKGARPGILALQPARVQVTHVASAGTVGLSTIDFKLTDRYADLPANQAHQIEKLLPTDGCVYPFRRIGPAATHLFRRESLGIAADAVVIGAFVTGLKLSRRCLALWQQILARVPRAVLAFSPVMAEQRPLYLRLTGAAGIPADRVVFVPQGRDDAENQARYALVDFVLDPMPYGGTNGTLEALDMGVPVVTLVGARHGERTSYSILSNLGVAQTIAHAADEYVSLAFRLAEDAAFMAQVRRAIAAGIANSPLTDAVAQMRALERAYVAALAAKAPEALKAGTVKQ